MTGVLIYFALALAFLGLVFWLAREGKSRQEADSQADPELAACVFEGKYLSIINRIFDPADYLWLYHELCFPEAARALARSRQELAIKWLQALRGSFNTIVRQAEPVSGDSALGRDSSWQLLWLTLKFHILINYALLVVRHFGPYYRLLPSFGWVRAVLPASARKRRDLPADVRTLT